MPVTRAFAVDYSTLRLVGLAAAKLVNCGRPLSRRILSSLHREPDRRKRNAHHSAFRQSLHCLIAKQPWLVHLRFRFGAGCGYRKALIISALVKAKGRGAVFAQISVWLFTLERVFSRSVAVLLVEDRAPRNWPGWRIPLLRNARGQTSSSCSAARLG